MRSIRLDQKKKQMMTSLNRDVRWLMNKVRNPRELTQVDYNKLGRIYKRNARIEALIAESNERH